MHLICGYLDLGRGAPGVETIDGMLDALESALSPEARVSRTRGAWGAAALGVLSIGTEAVAVAEVLPEIAGGRVAADCTLYAGRLGDALVAGDTSRLHGDFAIAHWQQAEGRLRLCRDPFGVRPLQYVLKPGGYLAFASHPAALLGTGLASRTLDPEFARLFPVTLAAIGPRTCFRDIASLGPGETLTADANGRVTITNRPERRPSRLLPAETDPQEIAGELRRLTEQAVHRRLPADGPGAGHFSGGLDSTSVSVIGARTLAGSGRPWLGYSFREPEGGGFLDESTGVAAAAAMASNIEIVPVLSVGRHRWLSDALDRDTLLPLGPSVPEEQVLAHAHSAGVRVIFSGWGGDQCVSWRGGSGLAELFWLGRWRVLARALGGRAAQSGDHPLRIFASAVVMESLPHRLRQWLRGKPSDIVSFARATIRRGDVPGRDRGPFSQRRRLSWLSHWWLPAHLEQFAQRGARYGIRYVYPLLDRDLVDFALTIPGIAMTEGSLDRMPFRRAMKGVLVDEIRLRREKLAPWPLEGVRFAEDREWIASEIARLRQVPAVGDLLDIEAMEAHVAAWPDPDTLRARIAAEAQCGHQLAPGDGAICNALSLAYILALAEECADD